MSDLISRSKVISILEQLEEHSLSGQMYISNAIYLLKNQPTAYDIDKVIEKLEKEKNKFTPLVEQSNKAGDFAMAEIYSQMASEYTTAIEIVKQGGVTDVLEELKAIKSDGFTDDLLNMGFTKGYNKAIDDFAEKLSLAFDETIEEYGFYPENLIRQVAERLKESETE